MIKLDSLFAKFKHVLSSALEERDAIASVISDVIGVKVLAEEINIKNDDIIVLGSSALKAKIFMARAKIMEAVEKRLGKKFRGVRGNKK